MPYCEPQNVRDLHSLITESDFPDSDIQKYIDKAATRINDKLRVYYVVPLVDPVPEIIGSICADMAGALICQTHFSGINYREDTPLAEVFRKRAESDLEHVIEYMTIEGLPGVVRKAPDRPEMRRRVASSTPSASSLKDRMKRFDNATQSPLANVRSWS